MRTKLKKSNSLSIFFFEANFNRICLDLQGRREGLEWFAPIFDWFAGIYWVFTGSERWLGLGRGMEARRGMEQFNVGPWMWKPTRLMEGRAMEVEIDGGGNDRTHWPITVAQATGSGRLTTVARFRVPTFMIADFPSAMDLKPRARRSLGSGVGPWVATVIIFFFYKFAESKIWMLQVCNVLWLFPISSAPFWRSLPT